VLLASADARAQELRPQKPLRPLMVDPCSPSGVKLATDRNARIQQCVAQGTAWVAQMPDDEQTWTMVRGAIANYLITLWRAGVLVGTKAEQAFFVRCDRTTMTQTDIDAHRLVAIYGVAPIKPAEFDVLRLSATTK